MEWFAKGWRWVRFPAESASSGFDLIWKLGISFRGQKRHSDGSVEIRMKERDVRELLQYTGDLSCEIGKVHGIPVILAFLKLRVGIFVGLILQNSGKRI